MIPAKIFPLAAICLILTFQLTESAKILFFLGIASHSHRVALQPLAEKLADRGHEVTFLSPIKPERIHPKIREVPIKSHDDLLASADAIGSLAVNTRLAQRNYDHLFDGNGYLQVIEGSSRIIVENPQFLEYVNGAQLDLIITDFPISEIAHAVAHKLGTKIILLYTAGAQFMADYDAYGLDPENTWNPDLTMGSSWLPDRWIYTYHTLLWYFLYNSQFLPKIDEMIRRNLGKDIPPVGELLQNVDMIFLNEHFSFGFPRSLPPYVVPVGGMHGKDSNGTLPEPVQNFLDKRPSKKFVFISFGSVIKITSLPPEFRQSLFDAVATFKDVSFLWKWEGELPKDGPKNVLFRNWFPQQDVLANPNCKGFVSQVGAMSFQQGIYHGVPIIAVPVWFDQNTMARSAVHHGVGIHLELADINKESFQHALDQILHNEKYSKNAKEIARRAKNRPMHPTDTAVWWTEYVLEHDTAHLKSPAIRQTWWQRRLLDIWALLFTAILAVLYILGKLLRIIVSLVQTESGQPSRKKIKST